MAQGMGIMDVLCNAIYNILKLKTLKLLSNMELIKKLYPFSGISFNYYKWYRSVFDRENYSHYLSETRLQNSLYSIFVWYYLILGGLTQPHISFTWEKLLEV